MKKTILILLPLYFIITGFNLPDEKKFLAQKVADITVFDATGDSMSIYDLIKDKPVVISPVYTRCYSICGVLTNGVQNVIRDVGNIGEDYTVLSFSFDSTETPRSLEVYESRWIMDGKSWKTISASPEAIREFMSSIGVEYDYIPSTKEYNHAPILVVLTSEGRVSRFIYGVNPSKKDLKISIMEANAKKIRPGLFSGFYLRCLRYDPALKTYKVDWRFIIAASAGLLMIFSVTRMFIKSFIED